MKEGYIAKKLQEKLILTALETNEFQELLKEAIIEIKGRSITADNEATVESSFESILYGLLKSINFTFLPDKEVIVDTRRHIRRGRIDSKVGIVVIEYKHRDKLKTAEQQEQATKQISGYITSLSTENPSYYGFITDGLVCKEVIYCKGKLISEGIFTKFSETEALRLIRQIILLEKTALTPENLIKDFCPIVGESISYEMTRTLFSILKENPTKKTNMLKIEWEQLFRLGHNDKSQQKKIQEREKILEKIIGEKFRKGDQYTALFALQTTYAILIKIIAYRTLSELKFKKPIKSYQSVLRTDNNGLRVFCQSLEDGDIFHNLGITNLLEGDFFSWYADSNQWTNEIASHIRESLEILSRYENASDIFESGRIVDLFKGLYEHIMPQIVRSSLGEFYTPSWLAEHVFLSVKPKDVWRGLDPCAGSGTFVLVMIDYVLKKLKDKPKNVQLNEVLSRVQAIDLNPLAVLTTRINYFIRISRLLPEMPEHIQIPVYLGDSCYIPESVKVGSVDCFKYVINTIEKSIIIVVPKSLTNNTQRFSLMMMEYEKQIKRKDSKSALNILMENLIKTERIPAVINELTRLTDDLVGLEKKDWDGIWARIISNFISTANLGRFDIIIGNPPWIDWKNLPSGYREKIKSLCVDRKIFSGDKRTGGVNLNVCALITSVSMGNWLKKDGKLAFLMPKVILFQQSYEGFRKFEANGGGRDFLEFHDWSKAGHPFYPVTEKFMTYIIGERRLRTEVLCVSEYAKKSDTKIAGETHISIDEAMKRFDVKTKYAGQIMPHTTAFTIADTLKDLELFAKVAGESYYTGREGIEFYPQELMLFRLTETPPAKPRKGCVYVTNIQVKNSKYKIPQEPVELETKYLFPLVKSTDIERFNHDYSGFIVPFPYKLTNHKCPVNRRILAKESTRLLDYYLKHEGVIKQQTDYSDRLRGKNAGEFYGLARVGRYSFAKYHVAFRDNTTWVASVVSLIKTPWGKVKNQMFQNHAVSICETQNGDFIAEDEAHYICAILNAPVVERYIIQSSDSRSFKIRPPVKIPKFDKTKSNHLKLSKLSKKAHDSPKEISEIRKKLDEVYLSILKEPKSKDDKNKNNLTKWMG
jgi:hypothetical protein